MAIALVGILQLLLQVLSWIIISQVIISWLFAFNVINPSSGFMRGLVEALDHFIRAAYELLDLISYFTVGTDEVRAWTIERGTRAKRAAGKIHSDLERGFIRAEVIPYVTFIEHGSENAVKSVGKLQIEGAEYIVQDGDLMNIRFNV
jgi:ribosome-binding ATPase YchF (GTP1/OBG family)